MDTEELVSSIRKTLGYEKESEVKEAIRKTEQIAPPFFEEPDRLQPVQTTSIDAPAEQIKRAIQRYKTVVYEYKNVALTKPLIVVNERMSGAINEILFLSAYGDEENKNYSVEIIVDGNVIYVDNWDDFAVRSNYETDMTCFHDDDYYVLHFMANFFEESVYIRVFNVGTPTFTLIRLKTIQRV